MLPFLRNKGKPLLQINNGVPILDKLQPFDALNDATYDAGINTFNAILEGIPVPTSDGAVWVDVVNDVTDVITDGKADELELTNNRLSSVAEIALFNREMRDFWGQFFPEVALESEPSLLISKLPSINNALDILLPSDPENEYDDWRVFFAEGGRRGNRTTAIVPLELYWSFDLASSRYPAYMDNYIWQMKDTEALYLGLEAAKDRGGEEYTTWYWDVFGQTPFDNLFEFGTQRAVWEAGNTEEPVMVKGPFLSGPGESLPFNPFNEVYTNLKIPLPLNFLTII